MPCTTICQYPSSQRGSCDAQEPTKHQYDWDAATTMNFLRAYGLEGEFKLNIECNHATLAGHSCDHELQVQGIRRTACWYQGHLSQASPSGGHSFCAIRVLMSVSHHMHSLCLSAFVSTAARQVARLLTRLTQVRSSTVAC